MELKTDRAIPVSTEVAHVGQRVRVLRQQQGLTLDALAAKARVSVGLISQLERGHGNPSFSSLSQLAHALGVHIGRLFHSIDHSSPLVRVDNRRALQVHGFSQLEAVHELLTPTLNGSLEAMWIDAPVGYDSSQSPLTHPGEEFGIVLSGHHQVFLDGKCFDMFPGDSITFDSSVPHWYRNPGTERVTAVWIVTPPAT